MSIDEIQQSALRLAEAKSLVRDVTHPSWPLPIPRAGRDPQCNPVRVLLSDRKSNHGPESAGVLLRGPHAIVELDSQKGKLLHLSTLEDEQSTAGPLFNDTFRGLSEVDAKALRETFRRIAPATFECFWRDHPLDCTDHSTNRDFWTLFQIVAEPGLWQSYATSSPEFFAWMMPHVVDGS